MPHRLDGVERVEELQGNAQHRPYAIQLKLKNQLNYAAQKNGLGIEVHSGGQVPFGRLGMRFPGSGTRHDNGEAADVKLFEFVDGKKRFLSGDNPSDRKRMQSFIELAAVVGVTGVGYGYMGPETIHLGGGKEAVWSAMKRKDDPRPLPPPIPWVLEAVERGRAAHRNTIRSGAWPNPVGPAAPGIVQGTQGPPWARHEVQSFAPGDAWSDESSWSNGDERLSLIRRMIDNYLKSR